MATNDERKRRQVPTAASGGRRPFGGTPSRRAQRPGTKTMASVDRTSPSTIRSVRTARPLVHDAASLFPLPLTPFEAYMYLDGLAGNSMVFAIQLDVEGKLDFDALAAGVAFAARRHPLSRALVEASRLGRFAWRSADEAHPPIVFEGAGAPSPTWNRSPDLAHESGVRVVVNEHASGATITVQFHHACSDGVGGLQWIEDMLTQYALLTGAAPSELKPAEIDAGRLADRARYRVPSYRGRQWWLWGLRELYAFFCRVPTPLAEPTNCALPEAEQARGMIRHQFTAAETRQLRSAAEARHAALNDLLMTDLFATIARWNEAHSPGGDRWYRVTMPTSLRERDDAKTPATNLISYTLLNQRHAAAAGDPERLLEYVRSESDELRRMPRGTMFLDGIAIATAIPGVVRTCLGLPLCLSTAVLTNVGDPCRRFTVRFPREGELIRVGNLRVTCFGGVPPLRRKTHASIGVNTYAGRLTLNLQMTPERFRPVDVRRFLDSYVDRLSPACSADVRTRAA